MLEEVAVRKGEMGEKERRGRNGGRGEESGRVLHSTLVSHKLAETFFFKICIHDMK